MNNAKNVNHEIDRLTESIIANKKNSNYIVDLLKHSTVRFWFDLVRKSRPYFWKGLSLKSDKSPVSIRALNSLTKIYNFYLKEQLFVLLSPSELELFEKNSKQLNADEKYRQWMHLRYADFKKIMMDYLNESDNNPKLSLVKVHSKLHTLKLTW